MDRADQPYHQSYRSDDQYSAHGHILLRYGLHVYMDYADMLYHQSSYADGFVSAHGHISRPIQDYLPIYDYTSFRSESGK